MARAPQRRVVARPVSRPERLSASERGYDHRWSSVTAPAIRERDGWLCQECLRKGGLAQAMAEMMSRPLVGCQKCRGRNSSRCPLCLGSGKHARQPPVDHKIPGHVCGPAKFHDPDNLEVLCDEHNAKKREADILQYGPPPLWK